MASSKKFEDVSVWVNKYNGTEKLHMKEGRVKGEKHRYINLSREEMIPLYQAIQGILTGEKETEIRAFSPGPPKILPLTLYAPTPGKPTYDVVLGGLKSGFDDPLSKVSFTKKESLRELRDYMHIFDEIMGKMSESEEENISRMTWFNTEKDDGKEDEEEMQEEEEREQLIASQQVKTDGQKKKEKVIGKKLKDHVKKSLNVAETGDFDVKDLAVLDRDLTFLLSS